MTDSSTTDSYDVAIVGGGSAGYAAARTAATAGLRTVVVDGAKQLGGLCILRGCMPSKALLWAAELRHIHQKFKPWGLRGSAPEFDWSQVVARKDALIAEFATERTQQLTSGRFDLVRATARFADPHTLELSTGGRIRAAHFVVGTGSVPSDPTLLSLNTIRPITSDQLIHLPRLPKSMIVLGGGAIAVEFAQMLVRFDVEVTLIQRSAHVLRGFDTDAAKVVEQVLQREGVRLFTGTELLDAELENGAKAVVFRHGGTSQRVVAEEVLVALGRTPNTSTLGLDLIGVQLEKGRITTNSRMQSSLPHIYAAGDCTGPHDIVHIAVQQGEIAAHNIAHPEQPRAIDYRLLTQVVFTNPQIASVGIDETTARARGIPHVAASHRFDDHGKSLIMDATDGFVKLIADPGSGEILGGVCVGPHGGELIHEIIAAMYRQMTVKELALMPHYHPTLAEIWTYPAETLAERLYKPSPIAETLGTRE